MSEKRDSVPTLPSPPSIPSEYRVSRTPVPRGVRKISGSMVFRFEEALKKLEEPAKKLDEVRQSAREACTPEEREEKYDRDITGQWNVEEELRKASEKKE